MKDLVFFKCSRKAWTSSVPFWKVFKQFFKCHNFPSKSGLKTCRISEPPLPTSSPLLFFKPNSKHLEEWREKDVAEANKRIITTGSKQLCKSIPSGHDSFSIKQRKTRRAWRCLEGRGDEKEALAVLNVKSHVEGHH